MPFALQCTFCNIHMFDLQLPTRKLSGIESVQPSQSITVRDSVSHRTAHLPTWAQKRECTSRDNKWYSVVFRHVAPCTPEGQKMCCGHSMRSTCLLRHRPVQVRPVTVFIATYIPAPQALISCRRLGGRYALWCYLVVTVWCWTRHAVTDV